LGTLGNAGAEVVMKSISVALVATAGGLLIAIPSVISNNYFNRKLKIMTQTMEQISETALASYHIKGEQ
jgi:biopolymer transport protein ExbB